MSIKLNFELSREDWKEAVAIYHRRRASRHNLYWPLVYAGFAATALGFLLLVRRPDGGGWVGPVALMSIGLFVPLRLSAIRSAQVDEVWSQSERMIQPTAWELDDNGIRTTNPHRDVTYRWPAFSHWVEGTTVILLYQTADHILVIPKRVVAGPEQLSQLRQMLFDKIPGEQRGFPVVPTRSRE
jgi:hypothetical protein